MLPNPELASFNPLMMLPTLVTGDGEAIFGSQLICDNMDRQLGAPRLFPQAGPARWTAARRQAIADGMLEAGLLCREDLHRFGAYREDRWLEGQRRKIVQGLDSLEAEAASLGEEANIGTIAVAVALGWLAFRAIVGDIGAGRPTLAAWHRVFSQRASMRATEPAEDRLTNKI
jgi:glutathione S-transferase